MSLKSIQNYVSCCSQSTSLRLNYFLRVIPAVQIFCQTWHFFRHNSYIMVVYLAFYLTLIISLSLSPSQSSALFLLKSKYPHLARGE